MVALYTYVCTYIPSQRSRAGQGCAAPLGVGGSDDVTVSNRVNLVDPLAINGLRSSRLQARNYWL